MDFKLGRATSFLASLDCPDRVLALSAGHAEGSLNLDKIQPLRWLKQISKIKNLLSIYLEKNPLFALDLPIGILDLFS
uniref:Uncharacterized protein n=1 Tax=Brassica oleracea TaxID=3712 RepID=A0A3P6E2C6_BRAOL|nr:unnamed protein product [Brassica oleracea]